jgi:propanol-preferring alcohol dehydrogenase
MMHAMVLDVPGRALRAAMVPEPQPGPGQLLLRVLACGVCRTDLHLVDGDLSTPLHPLIPGHEVVGMVTARGPGAEGYAIGERVGVGWLGHTCGRCLFCTSGAENLCDDAQFTGRDLNGGYAEYVAVDAGFVFRLPASYDDVAAAPLLCAGLIGYRAYAMAVAPGGVIRLGLYGVGAAAHLLVQLAREDGRAVYAFTRRGDAGTQAFARTLGACWAGASDAAPPEALDAAILFAPDGALVPAALRAVRKGGTVVCAGIHMSDIPAFPYSLLWGERSVRSVANLTRADGVAFFARAARTRLRTSTTVFPLAAANEALAALRDGLIEGAAVLRP